jgi:hypothetical protein
MNAIDEKESIQVHIASNDYFGTLATTIDLLRQAVMKRGFKRRDAKTLERLRDELLYLQAHYSIH